MRNPLNTQPKIVRYPCYILLISIALLVDALIFIEVADWLSLITFLIAFVLLIPSLVILLVYWVYKLSKKIVSIVNQFDEKRSKEFTKSKSFKMDPVDKSKKTLSDEFAEVIYIGMLLILYLFKLIEKLTRFYPFSLLFRNRVYHYDNRHAKNLMSLIEDTSKYKFKKKFHVTNADRDEYFHTLYGRFKVRINKNTINQLKKEMARKLKTDPDLIYLDKREDGTVRFSVPNDIAESSINSLGF